MIIRLAVVGALCVVLAGVNETKAATRDKLKIHVPQHIRDIHHFHKETIHHYHHKPQYARGYGYEQAKKPRYHSREGYKGGGLKSRGRRRRNFGGKRGGVESYARKYRNWENSGPPRKDLYGSPSYTRPQNLIPHQRGQNFRRPDLAPTSTPAPAPAPENEPQYLDQDYDHPSEQPDYTHLKQTPSQVGKKIHAGINEILGLISQYSGRREHLSQVREEEQRVSPFLRQQAKQRAGSNPPRPPLQRAEEQRVVAIPPRTPLLLPQRNLQHFVPPTEHLLPLSARSPLPPPVVYGSIGSSLAVNRFQSGRVDGDHDIGFGEGLEVVQDRPVF